MFMDRKDRSSGCGLHQSVELGATFSKTSFNIHNLSFSPKPFVGFLLFVAKQAISASSVCKGQIIPLCLKLGNPAISTSIPKRYHLKIFCSLAFRMEMERTVSSSLDLSLQFPYSNIHNQGEGHHHHYLLSSSIPLAFYNIMQCLCIKWMKCKKCISLHLLHICIGNIKGATCIDHHPLGSEEY